MRVKFKRIKNKKVGNDWHILRKEEDHSMLCRCLTNTAFSEMIWKMRAWKDAREYSKKVM